MPVLSAQAFRPGPAGPADPASSGDFGPGHNTHGHLGPGHSDPCVTSGPGRSALVARAIFPNAGTLKFEPPRQPAGNRAYALRLNSVMRSKMTVAAAIEVISAWS